MYLVRDEYTPRFGRQYLTLWSGMFAEQYEGSALELPGHNGYMITLGEYVDDQLKIKVSCSSPRTDQNFHEVDQEINDQLEENGVDTRLRLSMRRDGS